MEITSQNNTAVNTYAIEIKFSAEEFDAAVNKVYNRKKKSITIPGFRKGKATRRIIETHYGEGVFYEDAINSLYNSHVTEIVDNSGLDVVDISDVQVTEIDKNTGVVMTANIITKPVVEISDYKGINVKKVTKTVTEEDIDNQLEKLRERNARIITVEGRPAENGDTVALDFEGFVDGVPFEGGKADNYSLEIGSKVFIPGFEEQLIGKNANEDFDVNVTFPEDYNSEKLSGKEAVFKCRINEIKTREYPDIDDDFAMDVSEFDTLAELKEDTRHKLEQQEDEAAALGLDNNIVDEIIKRMNAEIPEIMFERRITEIVREWSNRNRISVEDYLKYTNQTMEQFRKNFSEVAHRQVKARLALEKIADMENLSVSEEDIAKEYEDIAQQYSMDVDRVKNAISEASIKEDIKVEKALDLVRDNAVIEEIVDDGSAAENGENTESAEKTE